MTNEQHGGDGTGDGPGDGTEAQQPFTPPISSDPLQPTQLQPSTPLGESSTNEPSEPLSSSDHEMTTPLQTTPPSQDATPLQSSPYSGQQPPQPPPPGGPGYPVQPNPSEKTNTLAIVALISAFFISVLGIILGHIALSQIKKTGEGGRGLALAGTIIGYVITAIGAIITISVIASALAIFGTATSAINEANKQVESLDEPYADEGFEYDDYSSDEPWVGTMNEAYCDALMNHELADDDAVQYYRELIPVTPNSGDAAVFEQALLFIEDPETMNDAEYDAFVNEIAEVNSRSTQLCYEQ